MLKRMQNLFEKLKFCWIFFKINLNKLNNLNNYKKIKNFKLLTILTTLENLTISKKLTITV